MSAIVLLRPSSRTVSPAVQPQLNFTRTVWCALRPHSTHVLLWSKKSHPQLVTWLLLLRRHFLISMLRDGVPQKLLQEKGKLLAEVGLHVFTN